LNVEERGTSSSAPGEKEWIALLAEVMAAERECCPFLRFALTAEQNNGPVTLTVTGPPGSKAFLKTILCNPEGPFQKPG
jgi:hypothetical protein